MTDWKKINDEIIALSKKLEAVQHSRVILPKPFLIQVSKRECDEDYEITDYIDMAYEDDCRHRAQDMQSENYRWYK